MPFDTKAFQKSTFEARTESVPVPDLADWFGEGEEAVFVVRGITAEELARVNEAARRNQDMSTVVEAIAGQNKQEKIDAMRSSLGISADVPEDLARRIDQFRYGCVDPEMDQELAVKFAETWPVEFFEVSNKIMELTGQGRQIIKKNASSEDKTSRQA